MRRSRRVAARVRMRLAIVALSMGLVAGGCLDRPEEKPAAADPASLRSLVQGAVVGFASEPDAHAWRGIPFAAPPVGALRWRAPRSPEPWKGTLTALAHGRSCVQLAGPGGGRDQAAEGEVTGSEDCLYLDVYAPRFEPGSVPAGSKRLPVMFWIHGGGNTVGESYFYDGSLLASREQVIVVTVHYRLGVMGWFAHPSLRGGGTTSDDRSGNYGTLDLVRGLEWVQENIAAFGGDPDRVTVFGESAGGSNTFSMLLSPRAKGLFHRAIVQSGSALTTPMAVAENFVDDPEEPGAPYSSGETILKWLISQRRASDREDAKAKLAAMSNAEIETFVRKLTAKQVFSALEGNNVGGMYRWSALLADGRVLPDRDALTAFAAGDYNRVPTILGTNRDENRLFMLLGSPWVTRFMGFPLWINQARLYDVESDYMAKFWKLRGVDAPAVRMRAVQGPSVYAYRFDWDEEPEWMWLDVSEALGAAHALELPFVFGWLSLGPATEIVFSDERFDASEELSRAMMSYWAQFAYTGDPGRGRGGDLPAWPSWGGKNGEGEHYMILDSRDDGGLRMARGVLNREALLTAIAKDARFEGLIERCRLYHDLARWGRSLTPEEYARVEGAACSAYPFDDYPWEN